MAGTAKPEVLWVWVGPTTITDWPRSAASKRRPDRPRVRRPPVACPTTSARRSPGRAQEAGAEGGRLAPSHLQGLPPTARDGPAARRAALEPVTRTAPPRRTMPARAP